MKALLLFFAAVSPACGAGFSAHHHCVHTGVHDAEVYYYYGEHPVNSMYGNGFCDETSYHTHEYQLEYADYKKKYPEKFQPPSKKSEQPPPEQTGNSRPSPKVIMLPPIFNGGKVSDDAKPEYKGSTKPNQPVKKESPPVYKYNPPASHNTGAYTTPHKIPNVKPVVKPENQEEKSKVPQIQPQQKFKPVQQNNYNIQHPKPTVMKEPPPDKYNKNPLKKK